MLFNFNFREPDFWNLPSARIMRYWGLHGFIMVPPVTSKFWTIDYQKQHCSRDP